MDKEESALAWKIAVLSFVFGIIGACIGGVCTFYGSYWSWNQQQKTLEQQQIMEQQNIAHAIYVDILKIELNLNDSMVNGSYNISKLDNISYVAAYGQPYYNNNWLYSVFGEDIARFDSTTSEDIYNFYGEVVDIEKRRDFIFKIVEKQLHLEKIMPIDLILAHEYSKSLYTMMIPDCILQAEKIKRELRLKYNVKVESIPMIQYSTDPKVIDLQGMNVFIP